MGEIALGYTLQGCPMAFSLSFYDRYCFQMEKNACISHTIALVGERFRATPSTPGTPRRSLTYLTTRTRPLTLENLFFHSLTSHLN